MLVVYKILQSLYYVFATDLIELKLYPSRKGVYHPKIK